MAKRSAASKKSSGPNARAQPPSKAANERAAAGMHRKLVAFDSETWQAVDLLGRDAMMSFQDLADEAFRDLLRKHGRPVELRDQLKRSARATSAAQADTAAKEAASPPKASAANKSSKRRRT